ncbi:hypothetical protein J3R82DRAFT_6167 [Butyriboletus roseoflavus]|nr:hypothetical protein J3R82DRAFT_6167 [Butyriboletus roseoflavus]
MVGAFHGHAHNQKCQLDWHPLYICGAGQTEGEGCEHVFSASNELVQGICHASWFHQQQAIEEHFSFWNQDKYEVLNALKAVHTLTAELSVLKTMLQLTNDDFAHFLFKERKYLISLKQPPLQDQLCICYVEVLGELEERQSEWTCAHEAVNQALTSVPTGDMVALSQAIIWARVQVDTVYAML